jgi:hypothetical protein
MSGAKPESHFLPKAQAPLSFLNEFVVTIPCRLNKHKRKEKKNFDLRRGANGPYVLIYFFLVSFCWELCCRSRSQSELSHSKLVFDGMVLLIVED